MKTSLLRPFPIALALLLVAIIASLQTASAGKTDAIAPTTSMQGSSSPVPNPALQFSIWQQTSQSTSASSDFETQFKMWQSQRTSADSINLFRCTTSTDLDSPECVGKLPATKITGTKEAKIPTTLPVRKQKTGDPD